MKPSPLSALSMSGCVVAIVFAGYTATSTRASAEEVEVAKPGLTTTQFMDLFGSPTVVAGSYPAACALGEVRLFAGPLPTTFLPADGRLLPIMENTALFAEITTSYGGNGTTNFALPSLAAVTPNKLAYGVCISGTFTGNRP